MTSPRAREFFERRLPLLAASEVRALLGSRGSLAFQIGRDAWSFSFGDPEPVRRGALADADLHLTFSSAAFEAFIEGTLDVGAAVGRGEIRAQGELPLLERFGKLLQQGPQALGWDHL